MKRIQIVGLFILMASLVWGQDKTIESKTPSLKEGWKQLVDEQYEIEYPEDWTVDKSGMMGSSFFLFSQRAGADDLFQENINLLIQDLSGYNLTLDQFVELSENQVRTLITDSEIVYSERELGNESEYHKIIYSGKQGIYDLKFEQYYWLIDNKAFILTFTCEKSEFDIQKEIGEEILNSFKIKSGKVD